MLRQLLVSHAPTNIARRTSLGLRRPVKAPLKAQNTPFVSLYFNRLNTPSMLSCGTSHIQTRYIKWVAPKKRLEDSSIDSNVDDTQSEALANKYAQALVIDQEGINLGVVNVAKVWATAKESNLKMTLVRESEPPVIKLEHKLTARDAREKKKKKDLDSEALHERVKEVRLSDLITEHDLQVKVSKIQQLLFTKHRVRITLQFKRRADFDASVGKAFLDNVLMRISEFSITEGSLVTADDRACAVTVRPISRAQLIAKGFIEAPKEEDEHTPTRKELTAEKRRLAELEREELKAQGLLVKKYLSPEEQSKLYAEQVAKGNNTDKKRKQGYDRMMDENDDDDDSER